MRDIISYLKDDYTLSSNPNSRKGGLVGLAATAIALGRSCIQCYESTSTSLASVGLSPLRGAVLVLFNAILTGLCKLRA
uniref:Uncharacterized protein n=1 Tax=Amphimedon queenslandica TaxID=400682 RepID=A0A1X7SG83_AMPQE